MQVIFVLSFLYGVVEIFRYVHMLQLSGYQAKEYFHWCKEHPAAVLPLSRILMVLLVFLFTFVANGVSQQWWLIGYEIITIVFLLYSLVVAFPQKAKKPLVFTKRVWRFLITYAIVYGVYLGAFGMANLLLESFYWVFFFVFVPFLVFVVNGINLPIEKAIANHFIKDAKRILAEHKDLIVIGITGSYGKTSTKNFLHDVLSAKYNTFMTPASFNTTMGVVRAIRENLKPSHEVFICEMGAKGVGEIKEICDIVHPQYGLITSIGEQHLETFLSVDNIIKTKFELADAIPSDGFVCLNYDNEYIANHKVTNTRVVPYTVAGTGYHAENIQVSSSGNSFTFVEPSGEKTEFTTKLLGVHSIQNIIGCLALARELGVPAQKMVYPVRLLKPVQHRLELLPNGFIDDAFNSNPAGFRAALDVLKSFEGQRILVTPGMVELGEREAALNEELGAYAANCCDWAVLVGERQAPPLKKGLLKAGFDEQKIYVAKSLNDGLRFLNTLPMQGKRTVLLENDLPDNYN
ncbi:MAG: UDP-N-acetylmuramoyl-tripeptide--D-alanyl-D-alanine ligase [Clostridia bacterium]|nr:UDP-N-acetylmuramoyl-tripeptide--D-alanyl-D-alanine ligase [Clostridia bacterium]